MIGHVESVTIEEGRECEGKDQEQTNTTLRRSRRARKRANFDEFMYYDDWLRKASSDAHPTVMDCEFRSNAWDDVSHKLNVAYNLFSCFISFAFAVFFSFFSFALQEGIEGGDK